MTRRLALALAAGSLAFAGCGGGSDDDRGGAAAAKRAATTSPPHAASIAPPAGLQNASCTHWLKGGDQGRHTLLGMLRNVRGQQVYGKGVRGYGTTLTDAQATRLFNARCRMPNSQELRLYKLYSWAADYVGK